MYLNDHQLAERFGVSRITIWRWARSPERGFPQPVKLTPGCSRWRRDEIDRWDRERGAARSTVA